MDDTPSEKAIDFLKRARLKLSGVKYRFFGLCLYSIRVLLFNNIKELEDIEGCIKYDTVTDKDGNKTAQYENRIMINSKIIDNDDYKILNLIDIMLHELNHILRRHDIRMGNRDSRLWNIACDHIIDKSLKKLGLSSPYFMHNIIKEIEHDNALQSEEAVYNWLVNDQQKNEFSKVKIDYDDHKAHVEERFTGNSFDVDLDLERAQNNQELAPEQQADIESYVSQVRAIYNIEVERGNIAGNIKEEYDCVLQVKVPWETVFEKAIKTKTFEKANRRNWRKLNKFYTNLNINLPGRVNTRQDDKGIGTLLIHIDSSGSMDSKVLKKAGYIVYKSADYFEKIILIVADISIHQIKEFKKNNNNEILEYFTAEGIKGRGGTSHYHVFDYFNKYCDEHINDVSICISITDMASDIDSSLDKFEFWKKIPLILLSTGNYMKIERKNIMTINVS